MRPNVARNACQLFGERQDLQFEHELLDKFCVKERQLRQVNNRLARLEPQRNTDCLNLLARNLELRCGQIA